MTSTRSGDEGPGGRTRAGKTSTVASTEAQNSLGEILARVARGEHVFITRYRRPEAVILSVDAYRELTGEPPVDLEGLEREFDEAVRGMQTPEQASAVDALFRMSGEELGEAAVARSRRARKDQPEPAV